MRFKWGERTSKGFYASVSVLEAPFRKMNLAVVYRINYDRETKV